MSVSGEFQRGLRGCVDLLRAEGVADAGPWLARLERASRSAARDLSAGATAALALLEGGAGAPTLRSELQAEEFQRRREHLAAICRVILGR